MCSALAQETSSESPYLRLSVKQLHERWLRRGGGTVITPAAGWGHLETFRQLTRFSLLSWRHSST